MATDLPCAATVGRGVDSGPRTKERKWELDARRFCQNCLPSLPGRATSPVTKDSWLCNNKSLGYTVQSTPPALLASDPESTSYSRAFAPAVAPS